MSDMPPDYELIEKNYIRILNPLAIPEIVAELLRTFPEFDRIELLQSKAIPGLHRIAFLKKDDGVCWLSTEETGAETVYVVNLNEADRRV